LGTLPFTLIGLFSISFYELLFTILLNPSCRPLQGGSWGHFNFRNTGQALSGLPHID